MKEIVSAKKYYHKGSIRYVYKNREYQVNYQTNTIDEISLIDFINMCHKEGI